MRINNCMLSGEIQGEIKLRETSKGVPVATVLVSTNQETRTGNVRKVKFRVTLWRDLAEYAYEHYRDGDYVLIDGLLKCNYFKDGEKRRRKVVEIVARNIIKLVPEEDICINRCYLAGEVTMRPELRQTKNDEPMLTMILAGEEVDKKNREQFKVVAWNGTANDIYSRFDKDDRVVVMGRLSCNFWTDENGSPKTSVVISADEVVPAIEKEEPLEQATESCAPKEESTYIEHDALLFDDAE